MSSETGDAVAVAEVVASPLPNVQVTTTGLVLASDISFDEWQDMGPGIGKGNRAFSWSAGDWLVYGEAKFPDRYPQAMEATGLSLGYLRNLASLCARVPHHIRNPNLSMGHHHSVSSFNHYYQKRLLDFAEQNEIDRDTFRGIVAEIKASTELDPNVTVITPAKKTREEIVKQAKHVAYAWRNNASGDKIGMTLHEALEQLVELTGVD